MPATSTLRQLLIELAERTDLGKVVTLSSQTTTTLVLTTEGSAELRGPFSAAGIPVGSPVIITVETSGTDVLGDRTYVSNWAPSTGTITVSPAIGGTDGTEAIILSPEVGDPDRFIEAVNRALTNRCKRWQKVPLTYVPDGDMLAATVTDFWTASAGTGSYQSLSVPEVASQRVVQISHSSSATLTGNTIPVRAGERWYFETAIRATTDGDTAELDWRDVTNSADITVSYEEGDGSTTSRAFVTQKGTFTVPGSADTDARIAPRLTVSGSGTMTAQMAPIIAYPQDARSFPLQQRVRSLEHVGNFYRPISGGASGGPDERRFSQAIALDESSFSNYGDHFVVTSPCGHLYYDELIFGTALTAMTDTTVFPIDHVFKWAKFELYDLLMNRELRKGARADNGVPLPSVWRAQRNAAFKSANWSTYEPELQTVRR